MEAKDLNNRLYRTLVDVVGTEEDIRCRQDMFTYMGIVNGFGDRDSISIPGGSLSEGFDLKGSDEDIMLVLKNINVLSTDQALALDKNVIRVNMQAEKHRPGYARLDLSEEQEQFVNDSDNLKRTEVMYIKRSLHKSTNRCIVASARFRGQFIRRGQTSHGPCVSDGIFDFAVSLHGPFWPYEAEKRLTESKSKHWLTKSFVDELVSEGCIYVPVGPRYFNSRKLWRISFAKAERRLVLSMRHVQWLCYGLLKVVFKEGLGKELTDKDMICSYYLKTCMFWLIEETDNDEKVWNKDNLFTCYKMCLDRLIKWVEIINCPNFILPNNNMFQGKVNDENKSEILNILHRLKSSGFEGVFSCDSLRQYMETSTTISPIEREAKVDLFCYRVLHLYLFDDKELLTSALERMEQEFDKEIKPFSKGIVSSIISSLHQELAQIMHVSKDSADCKELKRLQKDHLLKGCKADRLCGLILLASFHCTNGNYYSALEILNTVTHKITPEAGLLLRRSPIYTKDEERTYSQRVCGQGLCLEEKIDIATVRKIVLLENSAIVPTEFQPEVYNLRPLNLISPSVYAYALKFVCYHHLNEEESAMSTLVDLEHIIETRFLISSVGAVYSTDCSVVGTCFETQGQFETALKYYCIASNCDHFGRSTLYRIKRFGYSKIRRYSRRLSCFFSKHRYISDTFICRGKVA